MLTYGSSKMFFFLKKKHRLFFKHEKTNFWLKKKNLLSMKKYFLKTNVLLIVKRKTIDLKSIITWHLSRRWTFFFFFFFFFLSLINPLLLHVHEILVWKTKYARNIVYGDVLLAVSQTSSRLGIAKSQFSSRGPRENTML